MVSDLAGDFNPRIERIETSRVENYVRGIIQNIYGEDCDRDGLVDTPARVARMYEELLCGYWQKPEEILTTFDGEGYDEMILERGLPLYSLCEHHMLPFVGVAHIGYVPGNGRIVGLSKLMRLLEVFAKRLQVQERMTQQIVEALVEHLQPLGAICVIEAEHLCMTMRGVRAPGTKTMTSKVSGIFKDKPEARAEAMSLIRTGS